MKDWKIVKDPMNARYKYILVHLCEVEDYLYYGGWICHLEGDDRWHCCTCHETAPEEMQFCAALAGCYKGYSRGTP